MRISVDLLRRSRRWSRERRSTSRCRLSTFIRTVVIISRFLSFFTEFCVEMLFHVRSLHRFAFDRSIRSLRFKKKAPKRHRPFDNIFTCTKSKYSLQAGGWVVHEFNKSQNTSIIQYLSLSFASNIKISFAD